ncbi:MULTISPECIES: HIT family protein [Bacillaceae]|uniref:HIT family protein n=1 Tax=Evansella alkalicola TaxID=745819 RepID=A0ABS6JV03_9BACI|nr:MULTISPECIES: HIT family protein [Bacillaceae]MBU9722405.1 HIT family protein [Bacillus alkalicola]
MEQQNGCVFCQVDLKPGQNVILENEHCMFLQLDEVMQKGSQLEGSGLIVPKKHRKTAFDLSADEWQATYALLHEVKKYINENHGPQGYNLGWNCGEVAGQHIFHAHFHVIPRYNDEPLAGKGIRYLFKGDENKRENAEG